MFSNVQKGVYGLKCFPRAKPSGSNFVCFAHDLALYFETGVWLLELKSKISYEEQEEILINFQNKAA